MKAIVAVDQNWGIGYQGDQLAYIHADLKRFKELTLGHTVICGRKTLETFPKGKPLAGRSNIVLSRTRSEIDGAVVVADIAAATSAATDDIFVVGGASVYNMLLPYCNEVFVTKLHKAFTADKFFPNLDESTEWEVVEEGETQTEDGIQFHYVTYRRKDGDG